MSGNGGGQRSATGFDAVLLKVTVLGIDQNKVRLGFEAASDIPVHRLEVWEKIRARAQIPVPPERPSG